VVRRLAFQMAPPDRLTEGQLETARNDADGSVRAAAAVAGVMRKDRWAASDGVLRSLAESDLTADRAAAAWAAAFVEDSPAVVKALRDPEARVRFEGLRSFARMKGQVADVAGAFVERLGDTDIEVRREALRQAARWSSPADWHDAYAEALAT